MRHLVWPVRLTHGGLVAERAVRAFWPAAAIVLAALAPLMFGLQDLAPVEVVWGFAVLSVLGLAAALIWGGRAFRWPARSEALARVDAALPGRPISAIADRQAIGTGDPASEAVWRAHLARMAERTKSARAVEPDLRVSSRDPYGLRFIALLFFVTALLFGSIWRVGSVAEAVTPRGEVLATGPVWEGWIEPPAHTGKPSLYLADIPQGRLYVPAGSRITLRLYGEVGALTVAETVSARTGEIGSVAEPAQEFLANQDGRLAIEGEGGAAWDIRVIPDAPPVVELAGPVEADAMGEMSQPFRASDDYGVVSGTATLTLDLAAVDRRHGLRTDPDPREPVVVDLPMPFTRDRTDFEDLLIDDFSQHPFANLPVTITLSVTDAAGQTAATAPEAMVLPGRRFFQPVARAVIEQRRDLLWSKANARRVVQVLRAVSHRPEDLFTDETTYLRLSFVLRRLDTLADAGALGDEEQAEIAQALWDLAIQLEDGSLADARERLARAQERLAEAMRNGATPEEIEELMQELREAMNDYMRMLAQNAEPAENGADQPQTAEQEQMRITQDELRALMDRIQELMEEGRMAEAQELMEQLNQLMENLRVTQGGEGGEPMPGQQSMQDLAETLRDQQGLSDEAFRELQDQFNGREGQQGQPQQQGQQGQQGQDGQQGQGQSPGNQPGQQQGQQGGDGPGGEGGSLADRQQALRDELNRQLNNLPGMSGEAADEARRALERAEGAMDQAEEALRHGDLAGAIDRQAEAMDALRDGMRNLGEALAQNRQEREGQGTERGEAAGRVEPMRRDPLGRQLGTTEQLGSDENMLQDLDIRRRAEALLAEIRRRSAEQERPEDEREYLKRLLDRF